jgi:hypothetical protein
MTRPERTIMQIDEHPGAMPEQSRFTRREACTLGLGLSAGAFLGSSPTRAMSATPAAVRYVLTDNRHPESLAFGAFMCGRGAQRLEATDGLTRLWREALLPLWQSNGGAVAGLTSQDICTGIAEQARSWGRRPALVGRHSFGEQGAGAMHLVRGPREIVQAAPALDRCGAAWPQMMGCLVVQRPAPGGRQASSPVYRSPVLTGSPAAKSLVSWIIE